MSYVKTNWVNGPNPATPVSATNLNHAETQYDAVAADIADSSSPIGTKLSATFAGVAGANVARTIRRLQSGENLTFTAVGDSIADPATPGNTGGGPVEKLAALLETRFGVTIAIDNQAKSGSTALTAYIGAQVANAVAADADLFIICLGKNDISSEVYGQYAPGYPLAASMAAVERMCAAMRRANDKADILIIAEGPYVSGTTSNTQLRDWELTVQRTAAVWGAEWVDVYQAFLDYGDYSALMYDSTHQNSAGNDLYAATLAGHFPATFNGPTAAIAPPATKGLSRVDLVDLDTAFVGYQVRSNPATVDGLTYALTGAGWVDEATSTAGDYVEVIANSLELHLQVSTAVVDAAVVDVSVDGVIVSANLALAAQGKNGNYWVPFVTGLTPGNHTLRLTLKSGTLRTFGASALMSGIAPFTPETRVVDLFFSTGSVNLDSAGAYTDVAVVTVPLPAGWGGMAVDISATASIRVQPAAVTARAVQTDLRVNSVGRLAVASTFQPAAADQYATVTIPYRGVYVADAPVTLRARVTSTDKTACLVTGYNAQAIITRTA